MADTISMEDIRATAGSLGIDLSSVDWDSIHLPPGEDFGIKSDDEDLYEEDSMEFEGGFGNIIVVDNLPVVPKEKFEKLEGVVRKIYSQIGVIKENGLWMPVDPSTQKTLGYCFIEYNTPQEAELAKEKTNGYKLDRAHVFAVNMFDEIEKFMKVPDEWAPPETKLYTSGVLLRTTATSMVDNLLLNLILPQAICTRYGLTVGATVAPFVQFLLWLFFPVAYPISKNIQKGHSSIERGKQIKKCWYQGARKYVVSYATWTKVYQS